MEPTAINSVALAGSIAAHDMSMWGLFLRADPVVKLVMLVLLFSSFWVWAIIFEKFMRMRRLAQQASKFEEAFWSGGSLEDLYDRISSRPTDPLSALFVAAMREWRRSMSKGHQSGPGTNLAERIDRVMQVSMAREMERLERYMTFLGSVGSTAPFIGLFGTVWGIMHAFQAIAATHNTSLAVVAPGIAEALFTTALGLVAAIPAVVAYNKLSTDLGRYGNRLDSFAGEFGAILSRQLDDRS